MSEKMQRKKRFTVLGVKGDLAELSFLTKASLAFSAGRREKHEPPTKTSVELSD